MHKLIGLLLSASLLLLVASFFPWHKAGEEINAVDDVIEMPADVVSDPAIQPVARSEVEIGRALFLAKGCAVCHHHDDAGETSGAVRVGPDLSRYQPDPEFVRKWLRDPSAIRSNTVMPNLELEESEIEAIIAYLSWTSGGKRAGSGKESSIGVSNLLAKLAGELAACPITRPEDPPFIPPEPYSNPAPYDSFWFGSNDLWTLLTLEESWRDLPLSEFGYVQKVFWFRENYDHRTEPDPDLAITLRKISGEMMEDDVTPPDPTHRSTNGYHPELGHFMLTGVEIPEAGCWEITGRYNDTDLEPVSLSFVVHVESTENANIK